MSHRIENWRWRLAQWIAPATIMADPAPGRESFVVHRSKPGEHPAYQVSFALDKLDISIESSLPKIDDILAGSDTSPAYRPVRHSVTITGSAES